VVFTLPHQLAPLALQNKPEIYGLLFRTSAETLLQVARDPRHLGAEIGFFSVLHTWNQQLLHHPHVHCVVPAGGLAPDHSHWVPGRHNFFLPVKVLSRVFRGKFVAGLRELHAAGQLGFHGALDHLRTPAAFAAFLRPLFRSDWVVYSKRPFGSAEHALRYLGCYTHRVAISNHRLVSLQEGRVTFRWRDSAHKNKKRLMHLPVAEFLRRFLLHALPRGFVRIRHFGFLRPPASRDTAAAVLPFARLSRQARALPRTGTEIGFRALLVDLPALRRADDRSGAAHSGAGTATVAATNQGSTHMIRSFSSRSRVTRQPPYPSCARRTQPSTGAMQHSRVLPARGSHSRLQTCARPCSPVTRATLASIQNP
jgi:hypothetical protein